MSKPVGSRPGRKHRSESKRRASRHPLEKLLGEGVQNAKGDTVSPASFAVEEGEEGVIALYFSAHWCPPCKMFTPRLAVFYNEVKGAARKFEVVFVSFDHSPQHFKDYFSKMPWYAIDYSNSEKREEIASWFGIKGIPVLIFLDATDFKPITLNGREIVMLDPRGDKFPWKIPLEPPKAAPSEKSVSASHRDTVVSLASHASAKEGSISSEREGEQSSAQPENSKQMVKKNSTVKPTTKQSNTGKAA
ncbi:hypothetical protein Btru_059000 [Bulinus truncatus]|nr:hypothetical protein Btru_059000 [Bulinus truncatus]